MNPTEDNREVMSGMSSVIVVDEDLQERQKVTSWVAAFGFDAREADSADAALERMDDEPASIAICDLGLAAQDGLWLASEIRERFPRTAIVISSALRDVDLAVSSLRNDV